MEWKTSAGGGAGAGGGASARVVAFGVTGSVFAAFGVAFEEEDVVVLVAGADAAETPDDAVSVPVPSLAPPVP